MDQQQILERIGSWIALEPFVSVLMIIAALAFFFRSYKAPGADGPARFWPWLKKSLESAGAALLFLGLLWASRGVLNNNYEAFISGHGRVSQANYESVQNIWGGPQAQLDLTVEHSIEVEAMEELPSEDPTKPPLYKKVLKRVGVEQNSILSARGTVELRSNRRQKGSAFYNGFESEFAIDYTVKNDSDLRTDAAFGFPLPGNQSMISDLSILVDGVDISKDLRVSQEDIRWTMQMAPGEAWKLSIRYKTRGLEYFYFQIPVPRQIKDFELKLVAADLPVSEINYPGGCIPPTEAIAATEDGMGSVLVWRFDDTITTAGMGISLPRPEQPGERTTLLLGEGSRALMLLLLAICLTLILAGKTVKLLEIALIAGLYCVMYIVAASVSDSFLGFWGSFALGTAITLALSFVMFRTYDKVARACLAGLVAFFGFLYPLLRQVPGFEESLGDLVVAGLIVYLFFVALFFSRRKPAPE